MNTDGTPAPDGATANGTGAPAGSAPAPGAKEAIGITAEQLKQRLDETRAAAETAALKKLGFESYAAAERQQKALREWQDSQKSEAEKIATRIAELEPLAARAPKLEGLLGDLLKEQIAALPESIRKVVEENAKSPEEQLNLLKMFRASGAIDAVTKAGAPAPAVPPPAATAPAAGAPKPGSPGPQNAFEAWKALESNAATRAQAAVFYQLNRTAIERDRKD
jgi:hypothetical protein